MKHYELKLHVTEEELQLVVKTIGEILAYKQAKHGYWEPEMEKDKTIRWTLTETEKTKSKILLSSDTDETKITMLSKAIAMASKKEE